MFRIKTKSKKNEKVEETTVKEFKQPNSISKSIKILINKYFLGYIRYMDIQTGQIPSHRIRNFRKHSITTMIMAKEKVNYQEVYDLYQLCSETKDLREFCADYGVNYDKFMNWQRHQLWSEKLGKTVQSEQPKVAKVQITGKPCNSPTVNF